MLHPPLAFIPILHRVGDVLPEIVPILLKHLPYAPPLGSGATSTAALAPPFPSTIPLGAYLNTRNLQLFLTFPFESLTFKPPRGLENRRNTLPQSLKANAGFASRPMLHRSAIPPLSVKRLYDIAVPPPLLKEARTAHFLHTPAGEGQHLTIYLPPVSRNTPKLLPTVPPTCLDVALPNNLLILGEYVVKINMVSRRSTPHKRPTQPTSPTAQAH